MIDIDRVYELYQRVREALPDDRDAILTEEEKNQPEVVNEVQALLAHDSRNDDHLDQTAATVTTVPQDEVHSAVAQVGAFKIQRPLGKGGMGEVHLGVREIGNVQQLAAIKILKLGVDSDDILRRFTIEQRVIASLDHGSIARLLDAGTTLDGRPYFAMEYVEGLSIDSYCDRNRLRIGERLRLFLRVCEAVQHAHQNLVVHRDLKPSNIMVTDEGVPKLLDFGIAKLLNPELSQEAMHLTGPHQRLLTPEYASPEQVRGRRITTASDVYSLGIILFELLTGHRPYRITSRSPADLERIVCEQEPERPSTALMKTEAIATSTGADTTINPEFVESTRNERIERLRRQVSGDLDNIVLMALRKEPLHRYQTVDALAQDIQRHLDGHTVSARPPSIRYRTSKFLRRNRASVAIVALLTLAIASLVVAAFGRKSAQAHQTRAELAEARAEHAELARAAERAAGILESQSEWAEFFSRDIVEDLRTIPGIADLSITMLSRVAEQLEVAAEGTSDSDILLLLVDTQIQLSNWQFSTRNPSTGQRDKALASLNSAEQYCDLVEAKDPQNIDAVHRRFQIHTLAADFYELGTHQNLEHLTQALEFAESRAILLDDAPNARRSVGIALLSLADAQGQSGDSVAAEVLIRRSLRIRNELLALAPQFEFAHRDIATAYFRLGRILWDKETPDAILEAESLYVRGFDLRNNAYAENANARTGRDLANAHLLLANFYDVERDRFPARLPDAQDHYRNCLDLIWRLARASLSDERIQSDLAKRIDQVTDLVRLSDDPADGVQVLNDFREVFESRLHERPSDTDRRLRLVRCNIALAEFHNQMNQPQAAVAASSHARRDLELLRENEGDSELLRALFEAVEKVLAEANAEGDNGP